MQAEQPDREDKAAEQRADSAMLLISADAQCNVYMFSALKTGLDAGDAVAHAILTKMSSEAVDAKTARATEQAVAEQIADIFKVQP